MNTTQPEEPKISVSKRELIERFTDFRDKTPPIKRGGYLSHDTYMFILDFIDDLFRKEGK